MYAAHWNICNDLCSQYDEILIPRYILFKFWMVNLYFFFRFRVSDMIRRDHRNIGSDTVRKMMLWSHYAFKQKLKHKGEQLGCKVHEVSEHYTSKSCGKCGKLNH